MLGAAGTNQTPDCYAKDPWKGFANVPCALFGEAHRNDKGLKA